MEEDCGTTKDVSASLVSPSDASGGWLCREHCPWSEISQAPGPSFDLVSEADRVVPKQGPKSLWDSGCVATMASKGSPVGARARASCLAISVLSVEP